MVCSKSETVLSNICLYCGFLAFLLTFTAFFFTVYDRISLYKYLGYNN